MSIIGRLRSATAAQTDERVRLMGETIGGMLAAKMLGGWGGTRACGVVGTRWRRVFASLEHPPTAGALRAVTLPNAPCCAGWEDALSQQLQRIRDAEVQPLRRMATIRALNMALSYAIAPLVRTRQECMHARNVLVVVVVACPPACSHAQSAAFTAATGVVRDVCRGARLCSRRLPHRPQRILRGCAEASNRTLARRSRCWFPRLLHVLV